MREIKFRGKRVDNGEWVYGNYFIDERDIEDGFIWRDIPQIQQRYGDHYQYYDVNPSTVGQYTGLHDKNGKEIYEGDVVKWGHINCYEDPIRIGVVEINPDIQFNVNVKGLNTTFKYGCFAYQETEKYLEVIGNIYDNPELSEVRK